MAALKTMSGVDIGGRADAVFDAYLKDRGLEELTPCGMIDNPAEIHGTG